MQAPTKHAKSKQKGKPTELGQAIRRRRKAMGKTLDQVAQSAELTTGFLSQVERGLSSPSLTSLMSIAAALQTSIEQLLSVPEVYSQYVARDNRQSYSLGTRGRYYEKLGPGFAGALFHPQIVHRPAGHVSERMCHTGEAFCYLLSGQLEYHLGDQVFTLSPGDVIHHDTSTLHYSVVLGETEAVELWVTTSPINNTSDQDSHA
ncbi:MULTISPECIES: helix-turn-helix domain-containing protein [unclassified Ruegeria]|uniref:helix-turn-helix domain-containing protein n=1 Tax=unclassified Ruegeria TaxID=2625375 RepID=UPI0014886097|nr:MULTISPECIES: XRE family transcriptional regulator [unclassified Ruegeria]NOD64771.1 cupin domain-containing protein [Ruegeria sp. HKCCD6109]